MHPRRPTTRSPAPRLLLTVHYHRSGESFDGTIRLSKLSYLRSGLVVDTEAGLVLLGGSASPLLFRPHTPPGLEMVLQPRGKPFFPDHIDNFQLQLEDFVAACRGNRKPLVDAQQGLLSMRLLAELYANRKPLAEPWRRGPAEKQAPAFRAPARNTMTVGIVGASGVVGATLLERLRRQDIDAVAMIHTTGNAWRVSRTGTALKRVDIRSQAAVADAMRGCTHIVNCTRSSDDATMVTGLRNLLAEAKRQRIRRFVHLSSIAVYGMRPPAGSSHEEGPARPAPGGYGAVKLRQDDLVARAHREGLSCAILCPPNIGGIYSSFVCNVLDDIRHGAFALVEEGRMPINIVDVENLAYAIELALTAERVDGSRMFVTDGDAITWRDFTDQLAPLIDRARPLPTMPA